MYIVKGVVGGFLQTIEVRDKVWVKSELFSKSPFLPVVLEATCLMLIILAGPMYTVTLSCRN